MAKVRDLVSERDELVYYKGVHQLREQIQTAADLEQEMDRVRLETARIVRRIKPYITWKDLGEMLGMTELQAQRYLTPLMERLDDAPEEPDRRKKLSDS
jgi:hypothetical protein